MAYQDGFTYVKGPRKFVWSNTSSTQTYRTGVPVYIDNRGFAAGVTNSDQTSIMGVAAQNAADSLGGVLAGKVLVEIPTDETIYAAKVATNVAGSALSPGQCCELAAYLANKSDGSILYVRPDPTSATTTFCVIVPRDDGSTIDSADSSVFVSFLGVRLKPFGSHTSDTVPGGP